MFARTHSAILFLVISSLLPLQCVAVSMYPPSPTIAQIDVGDSQVTITWGMPVWFLWEKPYPVKSYLVESSAGKSCRTGGRSTKCTIKKIKNGDPVSFSVTANTRYGATSSDSSQIVIPNKSDINAVCGTANNTYQTAQPNFNDLCLLGSLAFGTMGSDGLFHGGLTKALDGTWSWQCVGYRQGLTQSCQTIHNPNTFYISGKGPAGGTVFYVTSDGLHGMEYGPALSSSGWGCSGQFLGVTDTAIGTGASNTSKILSKCSEKNTAAAMARAFSLNGYADWFLPSEEEAIALSKVFKFPTYVYGCVNHMTSTEKGPLVYSNVACNGAISSSSKLSPQGIGFTPVRSF